MMQPSCMLSTGVVYALKRTYAVIQ